MLCDGVCDTRIKARCRCKGRVGVGREEWEREGSERVDGRDKAQEGRKGREQRTGGFTMAIWIPTHQKCAGATAGNCGGQNS